MMVRFDSGGHNTYLAYALDATNHKMLRSYSRLYY